MNHFPSFLHFPLNRPEGHTAQQSFEEAHEAYVEICVSMVETMLVQMRDLLLKNPEVEQVSFDLGDEEDGYPIFSCLDAHGEVADDIPLAEEIQDQWNEARSAAVTDFLQAMEGHVLRRSRLDSDLESACKKIGGTLSHMGDWSDAWVRSFASRLRQDHMNMDLPPSSKGPRLGRM